MTAREIEEQLTVRITTMATLIGDYVQADNKAAYGLASAERSFLKQLRKEFRDLYGVGSTT